VSSYQADIYTNDKGVFCVNINGIEFPVYANGDEFNVDGITVRNWVGDNGNDSISYVYLQDEMDIFFKGSHIKRKGMRIMITNYKVYKYEMEVTLNESIAGEKKLTR
jgi:hypothetical protein